jgi:hypothetical protein
MSKRKIFDEMMEGVRAMKSHREGKITLLTYKSGRFLAIPAMRSHLASTGVTGGSRND